MFTFGVFKKKKKKEEGASRKKRGWVLNNAGRLGLGLEARTDRRGVRGRGLGQRRAARIKMKKGSFNEEHATPPPAANRWPTDSADKQSLTYFRVTWHHREAHAVALVPIIIPL